MDKYLPTSTTVREVKSELEALWMPARIRGDRAPPPSRVTFSHDGWMDFLSDPEIRDIYMPADLIAGASVFLGVEVVIDKNQGERFKVELVD